MRNYVSTKQISIHSQSHSLRRKIGVDPFSIPSADLEETTPGLAFLSRPEPRLLDFPLKSFLATDLCMELPLFNWFNEANMMVCFLW